MTGGLSVGIDLGGTKILGRLVDPARPLEVLGERRVATPSGAEAVVGAILDMVDDLSVCVDLDSGAQVASVGVGAAGLVDTAGVLRYGPNLAGLMDVDFRSILERRTGLRVIVDNDANVATWAEYRAGVACGVDNLIMVTLGTGIGGGVVIKGVLQRGASGYSGEMGHMLIDPVGPVCPCGRRGCWERFASGSALGRLGREAAAAGRTGAILALVDGDVEMIAGEHVVQAAAQGDRESLNVMAQFARWVALGLANLVNIYDPDMVVIGGGLAAAGKLLVEPVREAFAGLPVGHAHRCEARIELAGIGPGAGAIGAALIASDT